MEPLGKMNAYFPVVNEHIAKRNKKACLLLYRSALALLTRRGRLDAGLRFRTEQDEQAYQ